MLQRAPGDVQPAPGDHLLPRRRVARHAAGELQRAEADLRARRLRAREAQQRRQDPGGRPHVRRPPLCDERASPPRPRLVRAAARDVSELLRVVGAGDADEDLQRDAHGERRRLDVARVQGLRDAAVQRGGAPAQSATLGVALGALAELGRGVVAIRGRRRAQRRVDLAHALHDRGQIGRAGLDERRGRGAHAETRLRRVRAGARHDGSARDRRASTALSGPGVARCVARATVQTRKRRKARAELKQTPSTSKSDVRARRVYAPRSFLAWNAPTPRPALPRSNLDARPLSSLRRPPPFRVFGFVLVIPSQLTAC